MTVTRRMALGALAAVILTALSTGWFRLPPPDELPRCLNSPLLAFETAQSPGEAALVWNLLGDRQSNLAKAQYPDFVFIAAYTFLFLLLASVGRGRPIKSSQIAGRLVVLSVLAMAVADIGENSFTLVNVSALKHGLLPDARYVDLMRHCSLIKWAASGVTLILFFWIFLPSRRGSAIYRLLALSIAAFSLISGSMAILGMWDITKIELVFPFLAPALLLEIPLFRWHWNDVQESHAAVEDQPIETWQVNPAP
jgi:hypothetical protein